MKSWHDDTRTPAPPGADDAADPAALGAPHPTTVPDPAAPAHFAAACFVAADFPGIGALHQCRDSVLITETRLHEPGPRILYANPAFEAMTGYCAAEIVGCNPRFLQGPETDRAKLATMVPVLQAGGTWRGDAVNYRRDGTAFTMEWSVSPVCDAQGELRWYLAIQRDVSHRAWLTARARRNEELYRHLVEGSAQGLLVHDDHRPLFANRALLDMVGLSSLSELLAMPDVLAFVPISAHGPMAAGWHALRRGEEAQAEGLIRLARREGGRRYAEVRARLVEWKGRPVIQTTFIDVTERCQVELDLKQARDAAQAADRAKSEFLAMMSHNLRTPLNAVLGFAQILEAGQFDEMSPRQTEYLAEIQGSGRALLDRIDDILDLARLTSGPVTLEERRCDGVALARAASHLIGDQGRDDAPAIALDLPEAEIPIHADPQRLKQLLVALLSNAVKFTSAEGEIRVGLRRDPEGAEPGALAFEVADTGCGMSRAEIDVATEPFTQAQAVHTRSVEGYGLGLALAREIMERHGGRLEIDSQPGEGTRVAAILPPDRVLG